MADLTHLFKVGQIVKCRLDGDEKSSSSLRCIKGSYDDGYYDGIEDQFYCRECAERYGKER